MGEVTRANIERINYKYDAIAAKRKNTEIVVISSVICIMTFFFGYLAGTFGWFRSDTPSGSKKSSDVRQEENRPRTIRLVKP
jgi:uncharacterized membrane protein